MTWFWVFVECVNGVGHLVIAWARGAYFPGMATAPALLALSIYLAVQMLRIERHQEAAV